MSKSTQMETLNKENWFHAKVKMQSGIDKREQLWDLWSATEVTFLFTYLDMN